MSGLRGQCHVLPFFIPETSPVKIEHCDLGADRTVIRGITCVRRELDPRFCVFVCGGEITDPVFYWTPVFEEHSTFERGLELVEKGLGLPTRRSNLMTMFGKTARKARDK